MAILTQMGAATLGERRREGRRNACMPRGRPSRMPALAHKAGLTAQVAAGGAKIRCLLERRMAF